MKEFGLFILLLIIATIGNAFLLEKWSTSEIIIESTLLAYIMQ